jgi:hypothetical protein
VEGLLSASLLGLAVLAPAVDRFTAHRRPLATTDVDYAQRIFEGSVDYARISITRDSVFAIGAPRTIMNTIHLKTGWGHFGLAPLGLSDAGLRALIHEMGHVWQYQNGGLAYIPKSLWAQFLAWVKHRNRAEAYKWQAAAAGGTPWARWNPEQQAEAMKAYDEVLLRTQDAPVGPADREMLALLEPVMRQVRHGEGAPRWADRSWAAPR